MSNNPCTGVYRSKPYDELAVEVAMQGRGYAVRPSERAEAVRRLDRLGRTASQIAETLGVHPRTVWSIRAWLRATS